MSPASNGRDSQRSRVYAAEDFVRTLFDRAAEHSSRMIDFFGDQLTLPPEGRFGSASSVQQYVDSVLAHPAVHERWPSVGTLRVRSRRSVTAAHYERREDTATIAVPDRDSTWALRELVVLHEIAHHLSQAEPPHGPAFVAAFCELAGLVMGAEAEHVLRVVYLKEGVH